MRERADIATWQKVDITAAINTGSCAISLCMRCVIVGHMSLEKARQIWQIGSHQRPEVGKVGMPTTEGNIYSALRGRCRFSRITSIFQDLMRSTHYSSNATLLTFLGLRQYLVHYS